MQNCKKNGIPRSVAQPPQAGKHYYTIGEIVALCQIPHHTLHYWEKVFDQLRPMRRGRGMRRYYRPCDVVLVQRISDLLYSQGYSIYGARLQLAHKDATCTNEFAVPEK